MKASTPITHYAEARIQQDIVMYFRNKYCTLLSNPKRLIFSVPNERNNAVEQMRMIGTGLLSGVSDLIIVTENAVTFCEVKDDKGKQSDKQKAFEKTVTDLGYKYILVRSLDEFKQYETKL
jgi:hypothetical protein